MLVTGEVAVSLIVVILAGLMVRGFTVLSGTETNMDPDDLLTFSLSIPTASVPNDAVVPAEYEALLEQLRAIPGVVGATATNSLPFQGTGQWDFALDDRPERQDGEIARNAGIAHVTTDYFSTMGIPLLQGRGLTAEDTRDAPLVAVVSELMASRFWPGESALGKRFGYEMESSTPWITIVGIVPDKVISELGAEPYARSSHDRGRLRPKPACL